jgi:hypothetical protein
MALDWGGKAIMKQFHADLAKLQAQMDQQPKTLATIEPKKLEVSVGV